MAKSAKAEAKKQLGNLDLSYLDKEKETAANVYNTSKSSLENNFNNLISQINSNRADTRTNFSKGRSTVAENSYNANRANQTDLASRVVGTSGLKGLGEVGNRMETGRQYSNLANQFYNDMSELDTTEKQGRSQYDIDKQSLKNTYDQTLAGIASREGEAKNNYNMALGQLAEQIQGRWDSNANAEKALSQARQQAKDTAINLNRKDLTDILNAKNSDGKALSFDEKARLISARFNVDNTMAQRVLVELGYGGMEKMMYNEGSYVDYVDRMYTDALVGAKEIAQDKLGRWYVVNK